MRAQTWERRWRHVVDAATAMAAAAEILMALTAEGAQDGYSAMGGGGARGSEHADPTTAVALADPRSDLVADWLSELTDLARDVWATTGRCERLLWLVEHRGDVRAGRVATGGACLACDRWVAGTTVDRLRSGYCDACRKAFERWRESASDPSDHVAFRQWRRAFLRQAEMAMQGLGLGSASVT
jgi:hypothetical protein